MPKPCLGFNAPFNSGASGWMTDGGDITAIALRWLGEGREIALATVIETWGSSPRRAGAMMVIDADGQMEGSVSGGCVEGAVLHEAMDAIPKKQPRILEYGVSQDDAFAAGLACGGTIRILLEPVGANLSLTPTHLAQMKAAASGDGALISTVNLRNFARETRDVSGALSGEKLPVSKAKMEGDVFIQSFHAPPKICIIGAVHISQYLAPMARMNGYSPVIIDPREAFANPARFGECETFIGYADAYFETQNKAAPLAVCALAHDEKIDDAALLWALRSDAFYVGALGAKKTQEKRRARLRELGVSEAELARLNAPIGLDIGAVTPAEIATSVMAEIIAHWRAKS